MMQWPNREPSILLSRVLISRFAAPGRSTTPPLRIPCVPGRYLEDPEVYELGTDGPCLLELGPGRRDIADAWRRLQDG